MINNEQYETLKIYGVYVVFNKNLSVVDGVYPKGSDSEAISYMSPLIDFLSKKFQKEKTEEPDTIAFGSDMFCLFAGEYVTLLLHTERKKSEELNALCKIACEDIVEKFPELKDWNGIVPSGMKDYLNNTFLGKKLDKLTLISKTTASLEEKLADDPAENIDLIENATNLAWKKGGKEELIRHKFFLEKCTRKIEKQSVDSDKALRAYALLGWTYLYLLEFEMAADWFEKTIEDANAHEVFTWPPDNEDLKYEREKKIKNLRVALVDAYHGLAKYFLSKNDFLNVKTNLYSATEENKLLDSTLNHLREIDIELTKAIAYQQEIVELEQELVGDIGESQKENAVKKINKLVNNLKSAYILLRDNLENKIKSAGNETKKEMYDERLAKAYIAWGVWLSTKDYGFNEELNKEAIEKYNLAIEILDKYGIKRNRGVTYFNFARSYAVVGNFEKSKEYIDKLKSEAETDSTLNRYVKIAEVYYKLMYYSSEEKNKTKLLEIIKDVNNILTEKDLEKSTTIRLKNLAMKAIELSASI